MALKLTVVKGPDQGLEFGLDHATTCVGGRSQRAGIRFSQSDPYISRLHFMLEMAPPRAYFKSLDVTNPSRINDVYVDEAELCDGDIIEVGYTRIKVSLQFQDEGALAVAAPVAEPPQAAAKPQPAQPAPAAPDNPAQPPAGQAAVKPQPEAAAQLSVPPKPAAPAKPDGPAKATAPARPDIQAKPAAPAKPAAQPQPPPPPTRSVSRRRTVEAFRCQQCGADLTHEACSDGQQDIFRSKAIYCCTRCLPEIGDGGGLRMGPYRVISSLGVGGMGKVYLAYDDTTARLVAIKQMNIDNQTLAARFNREIRIMQRLTHPNLVAFLGQGLTEDSSRPYLVMEFCQGGSLEGLLTQADGPLPARQAVSFVIQALDGLAYLHDQGIVHRDIKPENLMAKDPGGNPAMPTIKIADFGLSREYSLSGGTVLTRMGTAMGSIMYMPPEQIEDAHSVTHHADIYSMGATLYHLLTGTYAYDFPTPQDVARFMRQRQEVKSPLEALRQLLKSKKMRSAHLIVLQDHPTPLCTRNPKLPAALGSVVDSCLAKDASLRPRTATEVKLELREVLRAL